MEQDDPSGLWCLNFIFHMLDNFDKKKLITDIRLDNSRDLDYNAMVSKTLVRDRIYNTHQAKVVNKCSYVWKLHIDREFIDEMYKDQIEDRSITTNYLELIILHEIAHLKYFHHKKGFIREWRRLLKKWLKLKGESGGDCFARYFKFEKKRYRGVD